jgi:hypothetical protein
VHDGIRVQNARADSLKGRGASDTLRFWGLARILSFRPDRRNRPSSNQGGDMNALVFGVIAGLVFGVLDVLLMIPLKVEDKATAMAGAFAGRFAIGFLIPLVAVPMPGWAIGALVGLLISLPDAIITKVYAPILGIGVVGGILIGLAGTAWVV